MKIFEFYKFYLILLKYTLYGNLYYNADENRVYKYSGFSAIFRHILGFCLHIFWPCYYVLPNFDIYKTSKSFLSYFYYIVEYFGFCSMSIIIYFSSYIYGSEHINILYELSALEQTLTRFKIIIYDKVIYGAYKYQCIMHVQLIFVILFFIYNMITCNIRRGINYQAAMAVCGLLMVIPLLNIIILWRRIATVNSYIEKYDPINEWICPLCKTNNKKGSTIDFKNLCFLHTIKNSEIFKTKIHEIAKHMARHYRLLFLIKYILISISAGLTFAEFQQALTFHVYVWELYTMVTFILLNTFIVMIGLAIGIRKLNEELKNTGRIINRLHNKYFNGITHKAAVKHSLINSLKREVSFDGYVVTFTTETILLIYHIGVSVYALMAMCKFNYLEDE